MRNLYGTNTRVFRRSIPTSLMPQLRHFKYCKYSYTRKTKRHLNIYNVQQVRRTRWFPLLTPLVSQGLLPLHTALLCPYHLHLPYSSIVVASYLNLFIRYCLLTQSSYLFTFWPSRLTMLKLLPHNSIQARSLSRFVQQGGWRVSPASSFAGTFTSRAAIIMLRSTISA
jgi:hypothetical protein